MKWPIEKELLKTKRLLKRALKLLSDHMCAGENGDPTCPYCRKISKLMKEAGYRR